MLQSPMPAPRGRSDWELAGPVPSSMSYAIATEYHMQCKAIAKEIFLEKATESLDFSQNHKGEREAYKA